MNINLSSLFINNEDSNMMQQVGQSENSEIKESLLNEKVADIKSLLPGMLFEGDVADINNLQVKIILDNNSVLNASMKEAVNLNIGDHVTFQVKENSNTRIVIKPVQGDEGNAVITKALNASGIAINEKNAAVVKELMTQGQPLDKNTIMDTVRLVNRFPEAGVADIIELKKHDIPVTSDNINMFKAYSEGNADISASFGNLAEDVPKVIQSIFNGSDNPQTMNAVSDIIDIIMSDENPSVKNSQENSITVNKSEINKQADITEEAGNESEIKATESLQTAPKERSASDFQTAVNKDYQSYENKVQEQPFKDKEDAIVSDDGRIIKSVINKENTVLQKDRIFESQENNVKEYVSDKDNMTKNPVMNEEIFSNANKEMSLEKSVNSVKEVLIDNLGEAVNKKPEDKFTGSLKDIPAEKFTDLTKETSAANEDKVVKAVKVFEKMAQKIENDKDIDMKSLKQEVIKLLKEAEPEQRKLMAESEPFKRLIHNAIKKNTFIKPDIIKESNNPKEEIGKLYEKVKEQLDKLSESVKEAASKGLLNDKQSAPLLNSIKTAGQNLNFMNELNHMASYIQIPVKFTGQEAAGELYVFNRNIKKTVEEGISAFLHFDLDNLGVTDIRINLKNKGLRIGFELNDKVSVKLVEEHIDELINRLEEKGYLVNYSVEHKVAEEHNSLEKIFEQDKKQVSIKRYTLDIRT